MTRRDEILKLIVERFIATAEPVGSKTLQKAYKLDISSATIRNEMNALENEGYLEKTHISSGRVPSDKGYQYYVENLREGSVPEAAKNALQSVLCNRSKSIEAVIKEACEILSSMTNLASVVLGPSVDEERLVKVQVIPLSSNSAAAVFVTNKGYVENKTFIIDPSLSLEDLQKMVESLNARLVGSKISEIVPKMEAMKPLLSDYMIAHQLLYEALLEAFIKFTGDRYELYGTDLLFEQPEFASDAEKLKKVLNLLDDPDTFREVMIQGTSVDNGVVIHFGSNVDEYGDISIVSTPVALPFGDDGHSYLTLLGPSRMDYESAVSTIKYFADTLDKYFNEQLKGDIECQRNQEKTENAKTKTLKK